MDLEQAVQLFHQKFGLGYSGPPRELSSDFSGFRTARMQEELDEYRDAVKNHDIEKQFDALIDLVYIAIGNAYLQGFPFNRGFYLVHLANMAKQRAIKATDSRYGTTLDIVKPPGWIAPDLKPLLVK